MKFSSGFSLVELMVVVALLALVILMAPSGLFDQQESLTLESTAHRIADQARRCSLISQELQRRMQLDSVECPIVETETLGIQLDSEQSIFFHSDSSSSGGQIQVFRSPAKSGNNRSIERSYTVQIDRITSFVKVVEKRYE